jgi:hypothetical protein
MYGSINGYDMEKIGKPLADPLKALARAQEQANRVKAAELLITSAPSTGDYEARDAALRFLKGIV